MDPMMIVYSAFVFLLTTAIGSFINVVVYRLPLKISLASPGSHCPNCKNPIKWYDNIPIISYIVLKGRCRYCKEKISPRYILVELLTGVGSTFIFIRFGLSVLSLFGIIMFLLLLPIVFIDIEHMIIPDSIVILLLVLAIFSLFFNNITYGSKTIIIDYKSKLIALGICIVISLIIFLFEKLLKRDLMGGGDIKLLCVSSLILGWQLMLIALTVASILSCIVQIPIRIHQINKMKNSNEPVNEQNNENMNYFPFGPYLSFGIMLAYIFGLNIIELWMSFIIV